MSRTEFVPAISILLPTWNGAAYLREQLDSIRAQTWSDFELLIVDDGSQDGTPDLIQKYAYVDQRIRILPAAGNLGQKPRLLELLGAARAPLIAFSDQDDIWHKDKIRLLREALGDQALAFGRSELVDGAGTSMRRTLVEQFGPPPQPGDRLALLFTARVSGHAMLVRRDAVSEMAMRRLEPFDWLIALDAAFSAGVRYVDEAVVFHRLHGGNQSNADAARRARGLGRLRPGLIYVELQSIRRRRLDFLLRLEHLAFSAVVDSSVGLVFRNLAETCRHVWFRAGNIHPFSDTRLRALILDRLKPLAGSDQDWAVATDHITVLTKGQYHPRTLLQSANRLLRY